MRRSLILMALGTSMLAAPACARDGAWYVGGDFGAMIVEDAELDFSNGSSTVDNAVTINHEYGYDGGLFVGYDLGAFRLEAEVAYKRARIDEIETVITLPGDPVGPLPPGQHPIGGGSSSALSFMINGMLDFGDDDGISGFVGGGAGIGRVSYNNLRVFEDSDPYIDDGDSGFAVTHLTVAANCPTVSERDLGLR